MYKLKYVLKVLVNHLVKLAQEKSMARWTWHDHAYLLTGTLSIKPNQTIPTDPKIAL